MNPFLGPENTAKFKSVVKIHAFYKKKFVRIEVEMAKILRKSQRSISKVNTITFKVLILLHSNCQGNGNPFYLVDSSKEVRNLTPLRLNFEKS